MTFTQTHVKPASNMASLSLSILAPVGVLLWHHTRRTIETTANFSWGFLEVVTRMEE